MYKQELFFPYINVRWRVAPEAGQVVVDGFQAAREATRGSPGAKLTSREREVLQLLSEGHSSKEIAYRLEISSKTVETHRRNIMEKLNLRSIAELAKHAIRERITSLDT